MQGLDAAFASRHIKSPDGSYITYPFFDNNITANGLLDRCEESGYRLLITTNQFLRKK